MQGLEIVQNVLTKIDQTIERTNAVTLLISLNLIYFAISLVVSRQLQELAPNSNWLGPSSEALYVLGSCHILPISNGEWERLFASCFLHVNIPHLALNLYGLWILGRGACQQMSTKAFLSLYLLSGLSGDLFSLGFDAYDAQGINRIYLAQSVGASGCVFGLCGFFLGVLHKAQGARERAVIRQVRMLLVLNLVIGFSMPQINNLAHIGGCSMGYFFGRLYQRQERLIPLLKSRVLAFMLFGVTVAALVLPLIHWTGDKGERFRHQLRVRPFAHGEMRRAETLTLSGMELEEALRQMPEASQTRSELWFLIAKYELAIKRHSGKLSIDDLKRQHEVNEAIDEWWRTLERDLGAMLVKK